MEIDVWLTGPNDTSAHRLLHNTLNNDPYVGERAQLTLLDPPEDAQGAELAVIQLVLTAGFDLGKLALAFAEWRTRSRGTDARIAVRANGRTTELAPEDLDDPDDKEYVVRRACAGAPDPRHSACVLVGVSDYATLPPLPKVATNLARLREVLTARGVWGVPPGRIHTVSDPDSADAVVSAISTAARNAPDTLLVYFAGHGLHTGAGGLRLALPEATGNDDDERRTLAWQQLADALKDVDCRRRIVWLDCCYAGLAADGPDERREPRELLDEAAAAGTYLLAAAQRSERARSSHRSGCTAFTGEIVDVLRDGIPPGPPTNEFLTLNELHQRVRSGLERRELPEPIRHDPDNIGRRPHFLNTSRRRPRGPWPRPWPIPVPRPRLRGVLVAGLAALAVLVVLGGVLLAQGVLGGSGERVSGLSLTKYCSALGPERPAGTEGFVVAGTDCAQRIDLDKACDFQYQASGLKARFTSPDANSAVCLSPTTGTTYSAGISNMTGYCATLTTIPEVTATAGSPGYAGTWVCRVPINTDLACDAQNNRNDLEAREEDGGWTCYRG